MDASERIARNNRRKFDQQNYKFHAEDGVHFLISGSAVASGSYYGFVPVSEATISSITYVSESLQTGDITTISSFPAGMYVAIPGLFSDIAVSTGELILFKHVH